MEIKECLDSLATLGIIFIGFGMGLIIFTVVLFGYCKNVGI